MAFVGRNEKNERRRNSRELCRYGNNGNGKARDTRTHTHTERCLLFAKMDTYLPSVHKQVDDYLYFVIVIQ